LFDSYIYPSIPTKHNTDPEQSSGTVFRSEERRITTTAAKNISKDDTAVDRRLLQQQQHRCPDFFRLRN